MTARDSVDVPQEAFDPQHPTPRPTSAKAVGAPALDEPGELDELDELDAADRAEREFMSSFEHPNSERDAWRAIDPRLREAAPLHVEPPATRSPSPERHAVPHGVKDEALLEHLRGLFARHSQLASHPVQVDVEAGVVRLSGTVESRLVRSLLVDLVESVTGVRGVRDELRPKTSTDRP
jgi:hypothetical protein